MLLSVQGEAALDRAVDGSTDAGVAGLDRANKLCLENAVIFKVGVVGVEEGIVGAFGDI